jgi:NAD(P) transhydrogenase subunit alpha
VADVAITTANVPGRRAPVLITAAMVKDMRPGAVIVDMAAESGGNCELTRAGEEVNAGGVTILGPVNLPASLPVHASQMYARNVYALLTHLIRDGKLALDFNDEITRETCLIGRGTAAGAAPAPATAATAAAGKAS